METREAIELLRLQRHDYLNQLQVMRGYLELKRPEAALGYLVQTVDKMIDERKIFDLLGPELAALFFKWIMVSVDYGVAMAPGDLHPAEVTPAQIDVLDGFLKKTMQEIGQSAKKEAKVVFDIQRGESGIGLILRWDDQMRAITA